MVIIFAQTGKKKEEGNNARNVKPVELPTDE